MAETLSPFSSLPPLLKQVLEHDENIDTNIAIEKANGLTKQQGDRMMDVIRKVIFKTITPMELVGTIQRDLGLDAARAKKLALDLLGRRFLAMEWYIGKVQPLIHELGGNVEEFLAEARKNYPEVYAPHPTESNGPAGPTEAHPILENFDDRIGTLKGKADILLRLTGLSGQLEDQVKSGAIDQPTGDRLMRDLESISYAVNTQELNPFEVNSIKRKLRKVLAQMPS